MKVKMTIQNSKKLKKKSFQKIGAKIFNSFEKLVMFEDKRITKIEQRVFNLEKQIEILMRK